MSAHNDDKSSKIINKQLNYLIFIVLKVKTYHICLFYDYFTINRLFKKLFYIFFIQYISKNIDKLVRTITQQLCTEIQNKHIKKYLHTNLFSIKSEHHTFSHSYYELYI